MTIDELREKVEDYEEDGFEVIALILDGLGNTGHPNPRLPKREALIENAYAFSDLAKSKNLAGISVQHTNSMFDDRLVEAREQGKTNLIRMMGRHCIADAKYIDRAIDTSLYILLEQSPIDGKQYLGIKREKMRQKKTLGSNIMVHELVNGIYFQPDVMLNHPLSYAAIPGTEPNSGGQPIMPMGVAQNPQQPFQPAANIGVPRGRRGNYTPKPIDMRFEESTPFEVNEKAAENAFEEYLDDTDETWYDNDFSDWDDGDEEFDLEDIEPEAIPIVSPEVKHEPNISF